MSNEPVTDHAEVGGGKAEQLAAGVLYLGRAGTRAIAQAVLVHPGQPGGAAQEGDADGTGIALQAQVSGGAQLGEHFAPHPALFTAQGAGLARGVGGAVGVALGGDALLLASAQIPGDALVEFAALGGLQPGQQCAGPVFQCLQIVAHGAGLSHSAMTLPSASVICQCLASNASSTCGSGGWMTCRVPSSWRLTMTRSVSGRVMDRSTFLLSRMSASNWTESWALFGFSISSRWLTSSQANSGMAMLSGWPAKSVKIKFSV